MMLKLKRKKILFLLGICILTLGLCSACVGYAYWGSNLLGGYPSFSAFRPSPPFIISGNYDEYRIGSYKIEVERFCDEAERYIENAKNDIEEIKLKINNVMNEMNDVNDEYNNFIRRLQMMR